jgi:hypothetical protein
MQWSQTVGSSMFGHGRYATRGSINEKNAHPFEEGDWVLVHNGTVYGLKTGGQGEPEVDSHALVIQINEVGLKEALLSIDGAYAIIAYNKATEKFYAAHNKERPLHYWRNHKHAFLMSTYAGMYFALCENTKYFTEHAPMKNIVSMETDVLYELTKDGFEKADSVKKLPPPPQKPYWEREREAANHTYSGSGGRGRSDYPLITGIKPGTQVEFQVSTLQKKSKNSWEYWGQGAELSSDVKGLNKTVEVCFRTNVHRVDFVDRIGLAPVSFRESENGRTFYVVLLQDIYWLDDLADSKDDSTSLVACKTCSEPIDLQKIDGGQIKTHDGTWMCKDCINDWRSTHGYMVTEERTMQ